MGSTDKRARRMTSNMMLQLMSVMTGDMVLEITALDFPAMPLMISLLLREACTAYGW